MSGSPELLNPAQVCKTLGLTPAGVKRLTREGYLEVKGKVHFKNGDMELFYNKQVQALAPEIPRIKQTWESRDNNLYGACRLTRARIFRHRAYWDKIYHKQKFFETVDSLPEDTAKIIRACYYLFHLNHYAKAGNRYLYDLKETVLHTFAQNYYGKSDLLQISFIEGENKVNLCPGCKARAKNRRMSYLDYLDKAGGCPRCTREYKYYSLYEFLISQDEYRFCFHTPYATAKKWFKNIKLKPSQKQRPRREGIYAFGRAIYESEARAVELIEVIEELQAFLAEFGIGPLIETKI